MNAADRLLYECGVFSGLALFLIVCGIYLIVKK